MATRPLRGPDTKELQHETTLTPLRGVAAFVLAVFSPRVGAAALGGLPALAPAARFFDSPYSQILTLAIAFLLCPQVFQARFWHLHRKTLEWCLAIAVIYGVGFIIGHPGSRLPWQQALWIVTAGPLLEEIERAVLVAPLLRNWGRGWAICIGTAATMLLHPDPAGVFVPMLLLTLMFVSVECSVLSTALGHVFINVIVEMAARIGQH